MRYYVALVISKSPFSLPKKLSKDSNVQHLITQEFEMGADINFAPVHYDSCVVGKSAPEYCNGVTQLFRGVGSSISTAVLDWLKNLCASTAYKPSYFKYENKK
ncbi:MAG: hypothetical protein UR60_C0015G0023 [Candidatus Moranbacteria bacterium GW2011_GWF2_34_56]|nr:MAG: hypothetical protein UR51_C0003G0007 [Candidatus Moranbacteria bacterium GW2011_GWF1_34_10]KKP64798.1 MAG: hypothetical protein UR60_C0015G0023 [Candidatus Moranbacteria bacterium GW2011_GWF2_34_56]HBI16863.1 hypothetical protein [Candidatus Moranbacteria bacterium]